MKDFSVKIKNTYEFKLVLSVLLAKGIPVYPATIRADDMGDYAYLGWTGDDVCRTNSTHKVHFDNALEFLAELAAPDAETKRKLRDELRQAEQRVDELRAKLEELE